jgi:hypothetical protein
MPSRQDVERTILDLLAQRDEGRTICPSEVTQAGQVVDPGSARGPIRLRLP